MAGPQAARGAPPLCPLLSTTIGHIRHLLSEWQQKGLSPWLSLLWQGQGGAAGAPERSRKGRRVGGGDCSCRPRGQRGGEAWVFSHAVSSGAGRGARLSTKLHPGRPGCCSLGEGQPAAASLAQSSLPLLFQADWSNLCPAPSWSSRSGLGFSLASHAPGVPSWDEGREQVAEAALRQSQVGSPGSGGRER